jgi:hypothetical protein
MDSMLGQFKELAREYLPAAPEGRHHAFSNVSDTISELHQGVTNPTPAGRGWGWWEWVLRVTSLPAIDSSTPTRTNSDMFRPAWIKRSSPIFWRVDISVQSMTAIPVGRAHCAPAVVTTRLLSGTATQGIRTFTTAIGFGSGPKPACKSRAPSQPRILIFRDL